MITEQIYAINAQMVYDLDCTNTNGKNSTPCPVCSPSRKSKMQSAWITIQIWEWGIATTAKNVS